MLLVAINFAHKTPTETVCGIKEYVLAESLDDVTAYVDQQYLHGRIRADENDPSKVIAMRFEDGEEAPPGHEKYGVVLQPWVEEFESYKGTFSQLTKWLKCTNWRIETPTVDRGVTEYDWSHAFPVAKSAAVSLAERNIAKQIPVTTSELLGVSE